jgi:uncharacterized RDD family membrane protein YckC
MPSPVAGVPAWAAPVQGGGRYAVPGAPGLVYAGAIPRAAAFIVDTFLVGVVAIFASIPFASRAVDPAQVDVASGAGTVITALLEAAYFILFWASSGRATLGMRLFSLQIGRAADGARLEPAQAVVRWLALGSWLVLLGLLSPDLAVIGAILQLVWVLALLVSTVSSPTRQGLHDRVAGSAIVRPAGAGDGLAITCLAVVLVLPLLAIIAIVALILLGTQVSTILSDVGTSI